MEKVIIWIVIIVIWAIYDKLKNTIASKPGNKPHSGSHSTPDDASHIADNHTSNHIPPPMPVSNVAASTKPQPPAPKTEMSAYKPIMQSETETTEPMPKPSVHRESDSLQRHYDKWRQAIIDTQILERKF